MSDRTEESTERLYQMPALTDEFIYQVIFCMEDQSGSYLLDLETGLPVTAKAGMEKEPRYTDLPTWHPADGFRVMEKFVSTLRNPIYREQLKDALARGKGVFRQFKNVLKQEPAVERLWFYFKEKEIKQVIYSWYEQQSEILYLENLGDPEENVSDLILSDFIITYDLQRWEEHIKQIGRSRIAPEFSSFGYPIKELLVWEYESSWEDFESEDLMVFIESPSGEFAGFIAARPVTTIPGSLIYSVRHLYVEPAFRGLGIFKLLADTICRKAEQMGADRLLVELSGKASVLSGSLERRGFVPISERFALDLAIWRDIQSREA